MAGNAQPLDVLDLIVMEITEANAADAIINGYYRHYEDLAKLPADIQNVFRYVEQSIAWKLALAVNRLLQPSNKDRATLLNFFSIALANRAQISDPAVLDRAKTEFDRIHALPEVAQLRASRNSFMAHTLLPPASERTGVKLDMVQDLLIALDNVVEDCYCAVTGRRSIISEHRDNWQKRADAWWQHVLRPLG